MTERQIALQYFSSQAIMAYCKRHPIDWKSRRLANGPGNKLTPSPGIGLFFDLLTERGKLFSQSEFVEYAWQRWADWIKTLDGETVLGINSRLCRNFYPSAIDSLHVWALLVESGHFAACTLDILNDAVGKTDLTVWTPQKKDIEIALRIGSPNAKRWARYKKRRRGHNSNAIEVLLPFDRVRNPGNKRWYQPSDLTPVLVKAGAMDAASQNVSSLNQLAFSMV